MFILLIKHIHYDSFLFYNLLVIYIKYQGNVKNYYFSFIVSHTIINYVTHKIKTLKIAKYHIKF
jgi:hypothetical protein